MQAKHLDVAHAAHTCCHCHLAVKNPIHDSKPNCQKVTNSNRMWSCDTELCTNGVEAWVSKQAKVEFLSYIFQFTRLNDVTVKQGLTFQDCCHTPQISQVVRTVRH